MNLFKKTSSHWVRYDNYEWKKDDKGVLYITPAQNAKPEFYNPLADEKSSLKVCKHCGKVFLASRPNTVFCRGQCKNQYNAYKSGEKAL